MRTQWEEIRNTEFPHCFLTYSSGWVSAAQKITKTWAIREIKEEQESEWRKKFVNVVEMVLTLRTNGTRVQESWLAKKLTRVVQGGREKRSLLWRLDSPTAFTFEKNEHEIDSPFGSTWCNCVWVLFLTRGSLAWHIWCAFHSRFLFTLTFLFPERERSGVRASTWTKLREREREWKRWWWWYDEEKGFGEILWNYVVL